MFSVILYTVQLLQATLYCVLFVQSCNCKVCGFHHWTLEYKSSIMNVARIVCDSFEMNNPLLNNQFKVLSWTKS